MKNMIIYLGQVIIISGLLYGYYHFFLRNKKFHHYNRYYLLSAALLSFLIPFWNIPVYFAEPDVHSSFVLETLTLLSPAYEETTPIVWNEPLVSGSSSFDWMLIPKIILTGIAFLLLLRLVFSLVKIRRIIRNYPSEKIETIRFVNTHEPGTPYSFFRWLFWNRNIDLSSEKGKQIFRHELFHINQKHSIDILFMEILFLLFFLNPFFWLVKKELRAIHEFLADRYAVSENNKWEYAELLLMQTLNTRQSLVNPFFHNQIKRRIAMITNSQKPGHQYLRKVMVLPLAFLAILLFAFNYQYKTIGPKTDLNKPVNVVVDARRGATYQPETKSPKMALNKPFKVVIDAGHGGTDIGAMGTDGTAEKDIVLAIAKKIKELNEDKNLEILLTRDGDVLPPLKSRTDFSNEQNADLFISLHVNTATDKSKTSFEILTPTGDKSERPENKIFAAILMAYLKKAYSGEIISGPVKSSIWVLQNTNCPAVLIGCGYMSNEKDMEFIKAEGNQEKIARSILSSIKQFGGQEKSISQRIAIPDTIKPQIIFDRVEVEPAFPGGEVKWKQYLERNMNAAIPVHHEAPRGEYTVVVQFIVDIEGNITEVKPLTKHGYGMEDEGMRLIKKGPRWVPAIQNGHKVKAYRKQPITFSVVQGKQSTSIQLATKNELVVYNSTKIIQEGVRTIHTPLDPRTLYIGIDNILTVESIDLDPKLITATISNGTINKNGGKFLVWVKPVIEDVSVKFYLDVNGKNEFIKEAIFKSRTLPEFKPGTPPVNTAPATPAKPQISVSKLQQISVHNLLQLPVDTEILSYTFTIDKDKDIIRVPNSGSQFNQATIDLLKEAEGGRLITIDLIRIKKDGVEKRIPSRIFYITD